ncbi:MAG: formyltransferase family protein [Hyphomicrobiaceae bacterium]
MNLRIAVFTCGSLGVEIALALAALPQVRSVHVLHGPYLVKRRAFPKNVVHAYKTIGPSGLAKRVASRLGLSGAPAKTGLEDNMQAWLDGAEKAGIAATRVDDMNSAACQQILSDLTPDLGVIAGTYILKPATFEIPRLGSINLHSGQVPQYRGAAPAFWELYNGETHVGITIHRVVREVDAGLVIRQELFPLDWHPGQEPMAFIEAFRHSVLRPNGVRLMAQAVCDLAANPDAGTPQDTTRAKVYRSPSYRDIVELRRRLERRNHENAA